MKTVNVVINLSDGTFNVLGATRKTAVFFSAPTAAQIKSAIKAGATTVTVKGYNVDDATIRNFNLMTIAKSLVIVGLKLDKELYKAQSEKCVQDSKFTITKNDMDKLFSARYITLCDNKSICDNNSLTIDTKDYNKSNLRQLVKVSANKPLYKAIVIRNIDIDSDDAKEMINDWVKSIEIYANYAKATKDIRITFDVESTESTEK